MNLHISLKIAMIIMIPFAMIMCWPLRFALSHKSEYLGRADYHHGRLLEELNTKDLLEKPGNSEQLNVGKRSLAILKKVTGKRIGYHREMEEKLRIVAYYPWQSVDTDVQEPGDQLLWDILLSDPMSDQN